MKLALCVITSAILGGLSYVYTQSYIPCIVIGVIFGILPSLIPSKP